MLLFFFHSRHQLCLKVKFGFPFLLLSGALIIQLSLELLLHLALLLFALLAFFADLLLVKFALIVNDFSPLILREHGGPVDA